MSGLKELLLIAIGGGTGSVLRYYISVTFFRISPDLKFPFATLTVNTIGCFAAGILVALFIRLDQPFTDYRLLLLTGLMGGFTTFSAFGVETFYLLRQADYLAAIIYVLASIFLALFAVILAHWIINIGANNLFTN